VLALAAFKGEVSPSSTMVSGFGFRVRFSRRAGAMNSSSPEDSTGCSRMEMNFSR